MSVSSRKNYTENALEEGHASRHDSEALAVYEFRSKTAVPTVPGVSTLAAGEAEWVFSPNTVFQVRDVVNFTINNEARTGQPLTVIRLNEVEASESMRVKNIHTGMESKTSREEPRPS
jgi:hypothetical protein